MIAASDLGDDSTERSMRSILPLRQTSVNEAGLVDERNGRIITACFNREAKND